MLEISAMLYAGYWILDKNKRALQMID